MNLDRDPAKSNIAVVGLGLMGFAVAARLMNSGLAVSGLDIDPAAEERARRFGIRIVGQHELSFVDILVTSLPDDAAVTKALLGRDGALTRLAAGARILDLSTIMPDTIRDISTVARQRDLRVIDCAVTGGPDDASAGALGLFVGGLRTDVEELRPLLSHLGQILFVGAVGDGKTVKIVNNIMTMGNVLIAAEAFNLGVKAGIPPPDLFEALVGAGGTSHQFAKRFPNVVKRDFRARFPIRLGLKDLQLAIAMAQQHELPTRAVAMIHRMYLEAAQMSGGADDIVSVVRLFESQKLSGPPQ